VFVPPGCIGGGGFWWDALAGDDGLEPGLRMRCLEDLRGRSDLIRREAHDRGWKWRALPEHACAADAATLDEALRLPGISAGSHSWSHPNLALATSGELEHELMQSRAWIQRLGPKAVPAIAYPYGASSGPVETAAASLGYVAGLRIDGGAWNPAMHRITAVPRFNVPAGLSISGLTLRIRGWFLR
jgi:peptidoglycan/xylan/chitin deacetylase (PgdA/CDA1 family)